MCGSCRLLSANSRRGDRAVAAGMYMKKLHLHRKTETPLGSDDGNSVWSRRQTLPLDQNTVIPFGQDDRNSNWTSRQKYSIWTRNHKFYSGQKTEAPFGQKTEAPFGPEEISFRLEDVNFISNRKIACLYKRMWQRSERKVINDSFHAVVARNG